jgi:hypothetical protein
MKIINDRDRYHLNPTTSQSTLCHFITSLFPLSISLIGTHLISVPGGYSPEMQSNTTVSSAQTHINASLSPQESPNTTISILSLMPYWFRRRGYAKWCVRGFRRGEVDRRGWGRMRVGIRLLPFWWGGGLRGWVRVEYLLRSVRDGGRVIVKVGFRRIDRA